ncbi:MAG: DNA/RNA non-specific endonuclease [bacterium]
MEKIFKSIGLLVVGLFLTITYGVEFDFLNESFGLDYSNIEIKEYNDELFYIINDNIPYFTEEDYKLEVFESYSDLDTLGRTGGAYARIGIELMPTEDRESISSVTPSGWIQATYDFVSGTYLYNRSHLIGFQLTGENANEKNLITGTRTFNVGGMLPFENMVADYIKETKNTVLYRITPVYEDDNLVASGIIMEAYSVEDNGDGIEFNVFVYNIEPGVTINYADGSSHITKEN